MYIQNLHKVSHTDIAQVGGKAASLGELLRAGIPVPDGFVITTTAYKKYRDKIPTAFLDQVLKAFDDLGAARVAVRSSAVAEDSAQASWAGQLETMLNVERDQLEDAIKACWQSINSDRATSYAATHHATEADLQIAVVVQQMVDSTVAGVAFSINPMGDQNQIVIEAVHGLGELLVNGSITPDSFVVDKHTGRVIDYAANHQATKLVYQAGGQQSVPQKPGVPTLTEAQIAELAEQVKKIEAHYQGVPQDIEWAFDRARLYIVQARPITT
jgi:rifampicin phosphotransferase